MLSQSNFATWENGREQKLPTRIVAQRGKKLPYYAKRNDKDSNVRCDWCFDWEFEDEDYIIMCDRCGCSVHINCYKAEDSLKTGVPEGDWLCQRC